MVGMKWVVLLVLANVLWWLNPVTPVLAADQIVITAQVLPQPADLPVTLTALNPPVGDTGPSTTLEYQISYENLYSSSSPLTIQASWSLATVEGSVTPSIPLLSYVPGSATTGYAGTLPVIDKVQRTITWSIASLPAGSGPQTVDFSLITSTYDSAALQLSFTVTATPTPTPNPLPTSTPLGFQDIKIVQLTNATAVILSQRMYELPASTACTELKGMRPKARTKKNNQS